PLAACLCPRPLPCTKLRRGTLIRPVFLTLRATLRQHLRPFPLLLTTPEMASFLLARCLPIGYSPVCRIERDELERKEPQMERRGLEYPTDYPLFSGMDEHGPQDEYAEFLVSAIHDDAETLLEAVESLADGEDVEMLLQIQQ